MKSWMYPVLRCLCVLLIGVLLVAYKEQWAGLLVILVGALFFVCGVVSIITWLVKKKKQTASGVFPLLGTGSALLGLLLMLASGTFLSVFMYVMGGMLVLWGVWQLVNMLNVRRLAQLPGFLFVAPVAAICFGIYAIWNPTKAAALPFVLIGVGCIVSGLGEAIALILAAVHRKKNS